MRTPSNITVDRSFVPPPPPPTEIRPQVSKQSDHSKEHFGSISGQRSFQNYTWNCPTFSENTASPILSPDWWKARIIPVRMTSFWTKLDWHCGEWLGRGASGREGDMPQRKRWWGSCLPSYNANSRTVLSPMFILNLFVKVNPLASPI